MDKGLESLFITAIFFIFLFVVVYSLSNEFVNSNSKLIYNAAKNAGMNISYGK